MRKRLYADLFLLERQIGQRIKGGVHGIKARELLNRKRAGFGANSKPLRHAAFFATVGSQGTLKQPKDRRLRLESVGGAKGGILHQHLAGVPAEVGADVHENVAGTHRALQNMRQFRLELPSQVDGAMNWISKVERDIDAIKKQDMWAGAEEPQPRSAVIKSKRVDAQH